MAHRCVAAFVAAWCAFSATSVRSSATEPFEVGIHLRVDPSISATRITDRLRDEAGAIWQPYGIRLEWTEAAPEPATNGLSLEASLEREFDGRRPMQWPTVLGQVLLEPDAPNWRQIRVSFDATRSVLLRTMGRSTMNGLVRDRELAAALGRVLAHEIGHVLLGTPAHEQAGLMRAAFRVAELAERPRTPFRLTCSGVDRLNSRLRVLAGHPDVVPLEVRTPADVENPTGTTREVPGEGASCIATPPTR